MKKEFNNLIVGMFMIAGFAAFIYVSLQFGEFSIFAYDKTKTYLAQFSNISGLKKGATVEIAGVEVGKVSNIILNNKNMAIVSMLLDKNVPITDDAIVSIRTQGIIGDKFIKILQGGSDKILGNGDTIQETESAVDIEEIISKYVFGNLDKNGKL